MGEKSESVLVLHSEPPALSAPFIMAGNLRKNLPLLRHFISRDLKTKYHGSIMGWGWSIVEPLALTVTFYILFAIISDSTDPYRPFNILAGILSWTFFSRTVIGGTTSLQRNASLIQRIYFPREVYLFSQFGFQLVQLLLSMIVLIPLLYHYKLVPTVQLIYFPLAILLIGMLAIGIAFFTSIVQVKIRDMEHIAAVGLRIGFYLTPVFYTLDTITGSRIPVEYADIYLYVNPLATYITMIRCSFTGAPLGISALHLTFTVTTTILIFLLGTMFFMRNERKAVKYL